MTFGLGTVLFIVAAIVFLISAWPGASSWPLVSIGLAVTATGLAVSL